LSHIFRDMDQCRVYLTTLQSHSFGAPLRQAEEIVDIPADTADCRENRNNKILIAK